MKALCHASIFVLLAFDATAQSTAVQLLQSNLYDGKGPIIFHEMAPIGLRGTLSNKCSKEPLDSECNEIPLSEPGETVGEMLGCTHAHSGEGCGSNVERKLTSHRVREDIIVGSSTSRVNFLSKWMTATGRAAPVSSLEVSVEGTDKGNFKMHMYGGRVLKDERLFFEGQVLKQIVKGEAPVPIWEYFLQLEVGDRPPGNDAVSLFGLVNHTFSRHPGDNPKGEQVTIGTHLVMKGMDIDSQPRVCIPHLPAHFDCLEISYLAETGTESDDPYQIRFFDAFVWIKHRTSKKKPRGYGEPHFETWSGETFDFQGECDLVFIDAHNFGDGLGLTIHIRTTIRYFYSYIESVAVLIGDDVFEVESFGQYALNGIDNADLDDPEAKIAGMFKVIHSHPDDKKHIFSLTLDNFPEEEMVQIAAFKDILSVKIVGGASNDYEGSRGLIGSYEGLMLGRDGKTEISDPNEFGQEWQVQETEPKLFRLLRPPQDPEQKCMLPSIDAKDNRQLRHRLLGESSLNRKDAENACSHLSERNRATCIFDVLAMNDLEIAQSGEY